MLEEVTVGNELSTMSIIPIKAPLVTVVRDSRMYVLIGTGNFVASPLYLVLSSHQNLSNEKESWVSG